jgi:hypothetical protein
MSVQVDDVGGDGLVCRFLTNVLDNKDAVKTGQDRALEIYLLSCVLEVVITTEDGVRCC